MYAGDFIVKDYIEERAVEIAGYIIETKATVRQTAKQFGISKSTVHKDCTDRLQQINPSLARAVRNVLDVNKQERHIRGGMATREKYLHLGEERYETKQRKTKQKTSVRKTGEKEKHRWT